MAHKKYTNLDIFFVKWKKLMTASVWLIFTVWKNTLVDKLLIIVHLKIESIFRIQIVDNRKL